MAVATTTVRPLSEEQLTLLQNIFMELPVFALRNQLEPLGVTSLKELTSHQASELITCGLEAKRAEAAKRLEEQAAVAKSEGLSVGIFLRDEVVVKVYRARAGHLLAKKLVGTEWVYLGRAERFVRASQRISLNEARRRGISSGVCVCCGRLLTNPTSAAYGVGPVCMKRYF